MSVSSSWNAMLSKLGASTDSHDRLVLADSTVDATNDSPSGSIYPLSNKRLIQITGPDTATFLQGQTTCNVKKVSPEKSTLGALCTPKGRMYSSFCLFQSAPETYCLSLHSSLVESTTATLGKYIVFSKAEMTHQESHLAFGIESDAAEQQIPQLLGFDQWPSEVGAVMANEAAFIIAIGVHRYECWLNVNTIDQLWPDLTASLSVRPTADWDLLSIRDGIGHVTSQTAEQFIPQILNYHITGAVSFDKGCYTGQEIVARMQYRGQLKRQMYRLTCNGDAPDPGTDIFEAGKESAIGTVVDAININDKQCEMLAVVTHSAIENNQLFFQENNAPLTPVSLPYAITKEEES